MEVDELEITEMQKRKEEIENTLKNLDEIIESRNNVLACIEKNVLRKTVNHLFSKLNTSSKGSVTGISNIKRNYELDLKLFRRVLFYLHKRKRGLEAELAELNQKIENSKNSPTDSIDLSQSTEMPQGF